MVDHPQGMSPGRVRWTHVVAAALVAAVSASLPSGMLWLSPLLLLAWWGRSRHVWVAVALAWSFIVVMTVVGAGAEGQTPWLLGLGQPAVMTAVGVVFGTLLLRGRTLSVAGMAAVGVGVGLVACSVAAVALAHGPSFEASLKEAVGASLDGTLQQMEALGGDGGDQEALVATIEFVKEHYLWLVYLAPAVSGVGLLLSLWVNLLVVTRLAPGFAGLAPLSTWRPPEEWIWGLIVGAVLTLTRVTPLAVVGLNLLVVGAGVYFLSGVAVGFCATRRWGIPGWMYAGGLGLLAVTGGLPYLALVGLLDFWLDFRSRWRAAE